MKIQTLYDIGDVLYLKTDPDQEARLVTRIIICPKDLHSYELTCGTEACEHYEFEISREKDMVLKTK